MTRRGKSPYPFLPVLKRGKRGGTVSHIQDVVRDAIVRLELAPGEEIDKAALCERLNVSRFPVSEALGKLADEGFVEILPQRGTRVRRINLADCREAMFIRKALEANVIRKVAARSGFALLDELNDNLKRARRAMKDDDRVTFHTLDLGLHDTLIDALGYDRVRMAVYAARAKLDRLRLFLCTPERQASTLAEHETIVAALAKRDGDAAAEAMEVHLDNVMLELTRFRPEHPDAFEDDGLEPRDPKAAEHGVRAAVAD
jgi:DNA-binding GntR family transcriptional regulator